MSKSTLVSHIMTSKVVSVAPDLPREKVLAVILEQHIGAVAVLDRGRPVGVISKGDLLVRTGAVAQDLMTPVIHSVPPNLSARVAARRMLAMQVHRLIVVDNGVPVGIVTATDFLRELLEETTSVAVGA